MALRVTLMCMDPAPQISFLWMLVVSYLQANLAFWGYNFALTSLQSVGVSCGNVPVLQSIALLDGLTFGRRVNRSLWIAR